MDNNELGLDNDETKAINFEHDLNNIEFTQAKDEADEKDPDKPRNVPFYKVYRYASRLDIAILSIALATSIIQGILQPFTSIIFRHLVDALINGQKQWDAGPGNFSGYYPQFHDDALHAIYMYVSFGVGVLSLAFFNMCCWHTVCERQIHQIRIRYFAAVLRQDMAWFDRHESGVLTTKMSEGIDRIRDGIGDKIGVIIVCTTQFCAGLVIAFSYSWKMTLVMLAFVPLMLVGAFVRRELREYGKAGAVAEEVIGGIRTVIAFNGQELEENRYKDRLKSAEKAGIKKAALIAFGTACIHLTLFTAMGVAFWYGTKLVIWGDITPGVTFALFWAVMGGTFALGQAAPQIGVVVGAKTAAASVFAIIDRVPAINSRSTTGRTIENLHGHIEFRDIHFRYPTRPEVKVLNGVSYEVEPGQTVALVGHSGCGKSTMVGLLLRFYEQEQGQLLIDGIPVSQLNIEWLRNSIGVVSQEPVLFAGIVEDNLRLGKPEMTMEEMHRVCKMANAHEFVMKLKEGYKTRIGDGGVQLSGGQKQRMAIARALSRDPKILLLDEATSALDTNSELIVQQALDQASSGRTTIAIAHRLSTIRNAHRIIVFDHGTIVESGTHDELMAADGVYRQLVRAQEITAQPQLHTIDEDEDDGWTMPSTMRPRTATAATIRSARRGSMASAFMDARGLASRSSFTRRSSRRRLSISQTRAERVQFEVVELEEELKEEDIQPSDIRAIIRFARQEWPMLIAAVIFSIIKGFTFPIFAIIYGQMFKALSADSNDEKLAGASRNAVFFTALGIQSAIATLTSGFLFGKAGERLTGRLRLALFRNILRQDGTYFDLNSSGKLVTRLSTDTPNIRSAIDQRLADVLQSVSAMGSGIAIAFFYGPNMAPIGVLSAVTLVAIQTAVSRYLKSRGQKDAMLADEPARLATEAIEQHRTVQYLTREQHFHDLFESQMTLPHQRAIVKGLFQSFAYGLHVSFVFFNFAIAYGFGVWLVSGRHAKPYTVFQVIESLNVASVSLLAFATYFPEYIRARLSAGLIFKMLQDEPKIDSANMDGKQLELNGEVSMESIHFAYPTQPDQMVLNGFTIRAPAGKTLALVGPSGCGKSTTVQLLERLYDPLDGRVKFDNCDARQFQLRYLRSQIALVGQEPILFNYSVAENISYGLTNVNQTQIEEAARLANAHSFITAMPNGYSTSVGEKGGQLSGGQKQRIAIARAIIRQPRVLLLDEATSALDTESEKIVQEALDKARAGRTCIVIAHRLSTIQNADIIAVLRDGQVIEQGNHQQLMSRNGLYTALINQQSLK